MPKSKRNDQIDKLAGGTSVVGVDELITLLNSPKRIAWLRFYGGMMAGAGGVLGAAIILIIIGLAAKHLGGIPWIGDFVHQISNAARTKQQ